MKRRTTRRLLSLLLSASLIFSLSGVMALATEVEADNEVSAVEAVDEVIAEAVDEVVPEEAAVKDTTVTTKAASEASSATVSANSAATESTLSPVQPLATFNYYEGRIGSFTSGGTSADDNDYLYTSALFIQDSAIASQYSNLNLIEAGEYDATRADGIVINDSISGHNGIIIKDSDYTINNANITMMTDADGTDTCDFSGKGAAIAVYGTVSGGGFGPNAQPTVVETTPNVTISNSYIETSGVATMPVFVDDGAIVTISDTTMISHGGTLYADNMNSPDQAKMVSPPWILGIMGTSRCTNLMGTESVMNVLDSYTASGAWAVLSTDSGTDMELNIYGTTLELLNVDESAAAPLQEEGGEISETKDNPYTYRYGSGYGTYVIGDAVETFAGATVNVGTYASIFTGGSATYTNIEEDESYVLPGNKLYYAEETKPTTINSDTFGFMIHQSDNFITIENGTEINSDYATFLVKSGSSNEQVTATIDDAEISNGGVLIQVMDNDDATNGGMLSSDDPLNTNGGNMNFIPYHAENEGFNTDANSADSSVQSFTFTSGDYTGNIYNASGSDNSNYGPLSATTLNVILGEGATLTGAAASTAAIHVTYDGSEYVKDEMGGYAFDDAAAASEYAEEYQNTYFTINDYFDIGQVANLVNYNGGNDINVTLTDDAVWYVTGTSEIATLTVCDNAQVIVPFGTVLTVGDGTYTGKLITANSVEDYYSTYEGQLGSFGSGGTSDEDNDYLFTAALFIMDNEIQPQYSNIGLITAGTYDNYEADGIVINDSVSGHNGIIIKDVEDYTIKNATIIMNTDADGTDTCDFSGKGSAIAVYGSAVSSMGGGGGFPGGDMGGFPEGGIGGMFDPSVMSAVNPLAEDVIEDNDTDVDDVDDVDDDEIITNVTIEDSYIETSGVATMPVFVDSGAVATIKNSTMISHGGTLYAGYMNSPDQAAMVAPPWILGIMGTSRCTNLMGNGSIMNVLDSDTSSGAWAVLSTDSGSDMILNIYNTSLELLNADESAAAPLQAEGGEISETLDNPYTYRYGSGYGTYVIGDAVETFAGATVNVGTYGSIFTGGSATYTDIVAGQLYSLDGGVIYEATETQPTIITSDTFGFMFHQSDNFITIENGTKVNSDYATFLVKSGSSSEQVIATIDNAEITNGGVLIQIMDNDDATNGGMMSADDPLNTNGGNMNFAPYHSEYDGFNTDAASADSSVQSFTFTNGSYSGNIYNASGSDNSQYGPLSATTLNVTLGEGASLTGAAASTAAIHVTYDGSEYVKDEMDGYAFDDAAAASTFADEYQNTYFTIDQYFDIGQVANLVNSNGGNSINIALTDDAVWCVTGTSDITSLSISDGAKVVIPAGVVLTVNGETYTDEVLTTGFDSYNTYEGQIGSFNQGGKTDDDNDYLYTSVLFIQEGAIKPEYSNTGFILSGSYDDDSAIDIVIDDDNSGHNGILIWDSDYIISGAYITMNTLADGSDTCDFSGKGSAIAVYGDSVATIEDSYIETTGVATMPVFVDTGATAIIKSSVLISNGGTLYGDYMNSPDQAKMVAPPWILGIMGTSRCTNLMGNNSTMHVIDSDTSSGAWAVLSTDSGQNMYLNIYNTSLTLNNADESAAAPLQEATDSNGEASEIYDTVDDPYTTNYGSGYGTYVIGNAVETFAGATVNVGTYASIFTGGSATYTDIVAGETYTLASASGATDYEYTATASKNTVINSDTFGFMIHQSPNYITIENGTEINSEYATFLVKSGSSGETVNATIDDADINNGGVLIQIMDNDDATNGGMMSMDDPANKNGAFMNFIPYHAENAGFNTDMNESDGSEQNFTFTNGVYNGNIYNASGSDNSNYGPLGGTKLNVTVGEGAVLAGAAASTAAIHVTYDGSEYVKNIMGGYAFDDANAADAYAAEYQNTYFDMTHYFDIGQVANLVNYNGANDINMTLTDDAVWIVTGTSEIATLSVSDKAQVIVPNGVVLTVGGKAYTSVVITANGASDYDGSVEGSFNTYEGQIGSFNQGGKTEDDNDYLYTSALFIQNGAIQPQYSNTGFILSGEYDDDSAEDIIIVDDYSGHNGILIWDSDYIISGAYISMNTLADGSDTCDFSGKGSAIAVYGDSVATIEDSYVKTTGVATMPVFVDTGATAIIKSSILISNGGTLYGDYMNSPDQAKMVAPPWILGIMGTSRCTNLMGNNSTMDVTDSYTASGAWAVLSTDSGQNMYLNIYNTTLELLNADESAAAPLQEAADSNGEASEIYETVDNPYTTNYGSGYGTYVIGNAVETFAGATVNVGTYASIFTGGSATYTDIVKGETYTLKSATGETDYEYTAKKTKNTVLNSDTFGFMIHQSPNYITIENGTEVNSEYATFLVKSGSSGETLTATIDDAAISNGGVLIQVMDNDDATNGGMMSMDDPANKNGAFMNFIPYHAENAGFNTDENEADSSVQSFTFTNGNYTGNIYNASGSDNSNYGPLSATTLDVTLGAGAALTGAVASTAAIHVTYEGSEYVKNIMGGYAFDDADAADAYADAYQNTYFDMTHYFDIGQVANLVNYNGGNDIDMTLTDDAVWCVTGTSEIATLSISDNAQVIVPEGVVLTVGEKTYTNVTLTADNIEDSGEDVPPVTGDVEEGSEDYNTYEGQIGSFSQGGKTEDDNDYLYTSVLFIQNGAVQPQYSNTGFILSGLYDDDSATDIVIDDSNSGHNGILIWDSDYIISGAYITMNTLADGSDTCDFSGKGSAIAVYGDSVATIEDSYIETTGVATMPVFVDTGATAIIKSSVLISNGGTLYGDYMNSPDQAKMVAPPWILGIMGTSRCTNLMGNDSTMHVIDSETSSGAWAVLSTDSGQNMYLNIYNTSLTLNNADESAAAPLQEAVDSNGEASEIYETVDNPYTTNYGSGYGTYVIGNAVETFAGATVNVGTYASIFTGGSATYTDIVAGETYTLESATGATDYEYTATASKNTVINSDTFGFMIHQSPNYITIENGTEINSEYATFLVKSGSSGETVNATIDDANINNGGVLIQIMDNDDATNGGMMSMDDPANKNGAFMNFIPYHAENAGFNTDMNEADGSEQNFTFTNGVYNGNIYNASGSDNSDYGPLGGTTLNVTIGEGAVLNGAVASTAAIHVTYEGSEYVKNVMGGYAFDDVDAADAYAAEYQNTYFDMTHYFDIGQVANLVNYNGANDINIVMTDDAVWTVTDTSEITDLVVTDDAEVYVPEGVVLTVGGEEYEGVLITESGVEELPDDNEGTVTDTDEGSDEVEADSSASGSSTGNVKTADNNALYLYLILIVLAGAAIACVSVRRRYVNK